MKLSEVTLACIDCRDIKSALTAMAICIKQVNFADVLFITDKQTRIYPGRVEVIPKITSTEQYSKFIFKELYKYLKTKFVLICQYDGFITNSSMWKNTFLDYDYIGAPWNHHKGQVGNGGFSLRSTKLQQILSDPKFTVWHPEDAIICRKYRTILEQEYSIKFAPTQIGKEFSVENVRDFRSGNTFGFHGKSCLNDAKNKTSAPVIITNGCTYYLKQLDHIPLM